LIIVALVAGCYPANPQLQQRDATAGYRFENCSSPGNTDDTFIVLAFSRGGTRAAAFSFGALEEIHATPLPGDPPRTLLDEVDMISSVSGGSFTAAYYGLYRDKIFDPGEYERRFLKKNIEAQLILSALNPINWVLFLSPYYSRIDMAAQRYDDLLFKGHTFGDLARAHQRPFIQLNSTDMSQGSRFEFTQDQFDLLYSDLSQVKIARGVAASSAFPGLLCPLTIKNYPKAADFRLPVWVELAKGDLAVNPRRYKHAQDVDQYVHDPNKRFIHLLDGGLADNIGLRGPWYSLESTDKLSTQSLSLMQKINQGKIKKLVVIAVNAKPSDDAGLDKRESTPGIFSVLMATSSAPMANYSFDTVELMRKSLEQIKKDQEGDPSNSSWKNLKPYFVELSFEAVQDETTRRKLQSLGTNYSLKPEEIDLLRCTARQQLKNSPVYQQLLRDLAADHPTTQP
jgi:NTE family protein